MEWVRRKTPLQLVTVLETCGTELSHLKSIQRMYKSSNKQTLVCGAAASDQNWKDNFWFV